MGYPRRGQISLTAGVMQAFDALLKHLHLGFALPVVALALAIGALGNDRAWLDGPSEGLLKIGREQGYLPRYFQKVNDEGIPLHILIAQGVVITVIGFLYAFSGLSTARTGCSPRFHPGLPDHVRADVHRRNQTAAHAARPSAWVQGARAPACCAHSEPLIAGRVPDLVRAAITVRPREPPVYGSR